jgi:hypothetical protein
VFPACLLKERVVTDRLAALFFSPVTTVGQGIYRPGSFDLRLRGDADLGRRLVPYHETQHVALTTSSAWGAALLVAAEMPGWERLFSQMLDRCRTTHESFATHLSRSATEAFRSPDAALAACPDHAVLVGRLRRLLAPVTATNVRLSP